MTKSTDIQTADVLDVAEDLGFNPTVGEINSILENYPIEQNNDPTANWRLVVEQCLYQMGVEQRPKQKAK